MARRIESLFVPGPAGRLEAILEEPDNQEAVEAAVVCHPHPQHGGTMHNKVVHRLARGLRNSGCAVLRFNFRGVNLSEGVYDHGKGETEDARSALVELRSRYPLLPALIAGFSFGSRVALRVAGSAPAVSRVIAVGFPTKYPNREYVREVRIPKFFIQSTHDEFGPRAEMQEFFESLPPPKQLSFVEAEDHFFRGSLDAYEAEVLRVGVLH
jgi:alpha/beta superfamily hydrolase